MTLRFAFQALSTLLLALVSALVCRELHVPLPWVIGPLVVTAAVSMTGLPTQSWGPLRNGAQWIVGIALGLYFTPDVAALMLRLWWVILLAIVWALFLGWANGHWLHRMVTRALPGDPRAMRATSFFASAIGGVSEMTQQAAREGARTDLVASAHSLRILMVTVLVPFGVTFAGMQGLDQALPGAREVSLPGLAILGALTLAGGWLLGRTPVANPWFIGSLFAAVLLTSSGVELSTVPTAFVNAAQLLIGVSLGVQFRSDFVHTAPRWLAAVGVGSLAMMALCVGFSLVLSQLTGLQFATAILSTAPGGIGEMAITAKVLKLGVPVVTAFQVCRLAAVILLVGPMYRRIYPRG